MAKKTNFKAVENLLKPPNFVLSQVFSEWEN